MMKQELSEEQKIWINANNLTPNQYEIIDIEETKDLKKRWRSVFIPHIKNDEILHKCPICHNGDIRSYDWHAFSYKEAEGIEVNGDFLKEKLKSQSRHLYIVWEECNSVGLIINSEIIKKCKWTNTDIYIYDTIFKWTYVVTLEGWFYFKEKN